MEFIVNDEFDFMGGMKYNALYIGDSVYGDTLMTAHNGYSKGGTSIQSDTVVMPMTDKEAIKLRDYLSKRYPREVDFNV